MNYIALLRNASFGGLLCLGVQSMAIAASFTLQAISDFPVIDAGEAPYYIETVGGRNALTINAGDDAFRNVFARAEAPFTGPAGNYDVTITTLGETDGDCEYRFSVNGVVQGSAINSPANVDYEVQQHTFPGITIPADAVLAVESNAVSNNSVPEGAGFAYARGRWRTLTLESIVDDNSDVIVVDLALSITTTNSEPQLGEELSFWISVFNDDDLQVATAPAINSVLPDSLEFVSSEHCSHSAAGLVCDLPEIPAMSIETVSFTTRVVESGLIELSATASADQAEPDMSNNTGSIRLTTSGSNATTTAPESQAATGKTYVETGTGAVAFRFILPVMLGFLFIHRRRRISL